MGSELSYIEFIENCITMDAERLAILGALVQQQNEQILRLQCVMDEGEDREEGETDLCGFVMIIKNLYKKFCNPQ